MNVEIIKHIIGENLNIDKTKIYNFNKKFKKIKDINDFKTINDISIQLSYLYVKEKINNNNVINAPSNKEERKEDIDTTNYVSKEKYDKTKKNSNHYKQQVEQRNSMIKELNDKIEELKDVYKNLNTLEVNYKKLEIEHCNLFRVYSDMKEQNDDLKEENDNLYKELFKLKKQYNII